MAGLKVVIVKCDNNGNIDLEDLTNKVTEAGDTLSSLMVTYPSTHGVFEHNIDEVCALIHDNGGLVYMDGANLNAMVGVCKPGNFGADVMHINLHKTFSTPHGGGGPGSGPVVFSDKLASFCPAPKIEKIREDYEAKIKEILTKEQYKKYEETRSARGGQGRRPGQGGRRPDGERPEGSPQPRPNRPNRSEA